MVLLTTGLHWSHFPESPSLDGSGLDLAKSGTSVALQAETGAWPSDTWLPVDFLTPSCFVGSFQQVGFPNWHTPSSAQHLPGGVGSIPIRNLFSHNSHNSESASLIKP